MDVAELQRFAERRQQIVDAAADPFRTLDDVAVEFGITKQRVAQILVSRGISNRRRQFISKSRLIIRRIAPEWFVRDLMDSGELVPIGKTRSEVFFSDDSEQVIQRLWDERRPRCKKCSDPIMAGCTYCKTCRHDPAVARARYLDRTQIHVGRCNSLLGLIRNKLRKSSTDLTLTLGEFYKISGLTGGIAYYLRDCGVISHSGGYRLNRTPGRWSKSEAKQIAALRRKAATRT